jgi:hypothetical protein
MQVSLDPIDWGDTAPFTDAEDFYRFLEEPGASPAAAASARVWRSDSANQYFEAAEILGKLCRAVDPATRRHLEQGICRLVAENGQVDELGTADLTEGCYWISARQETARELLAHVEAVDFAALLALRDRLVPARQPAAESAADDPRYAAILAGHHRVMASALERCGSSTAPSSVSPWSTATACSATAADLLHPGIVARRGDFLSPGPARA